MILASTAMAIFAGVSMVGAVGSQGVDGAMSGDNLRKGIQDTEDKTAELKSKYDAVISKANQWDAKMHQDMLNDLDALDQLAATLDVNRQKFQKTKRNIQVIGIFFVVTLIFLLMLRRLNVFNWLEDALR